MSNQKSGKKKKIAAIVPSAGIGKRFGSNKNKAFHMLMGKPVIVWSLELLESIGNVAEIVPVFNKNDLQEGSRLIKKYGISKIKKIAIGGKERQNSVYNALNLIDKDTDIVLIHDAVRPLVEKAQVEKALKQLEGIDGIIIGVQPKDTIKELFYKTHKGKNELFVKKTLDRRALLAVQTPQIFKYEVLVKAYKKAMREGFYSTDDSAIVEKFGGRIKIILGSYSNIKITTPEDIETARILIKKKRRRRKA
jgi:2-C-methyl-D-erythritol 4-phosphate cytidylyltransferase